MDEESSFEPEFTNKTSLYDDGPSSTRYTAVFFPEAKHFVVSGGNFTNITQTAPRDSPDFRMIPMGDLNLLHKIQSSTRSSPGWRRKGRASIRRMFSARIAGLQSSMTLTVALYQGDGAEEEWRAEISRYSDLRHPNLFQLYGIASTRRLHAVVFHNGSHLYSPTQRPICNEKMLD
ncbi:hypothetical protein B0H19DRAFT_1187948 [Mycena capillaripes]|nr:hypothetical protein B0H19DRAFT_1187948 [Mycena capillaripes]